MQLALRADILLPDDHAQAITRVTEVLQAEGFGILTRIDLHQAFQERLGVTFRPYTILGACNPALAHRAIGEEPLAGLMLPCNVTVEAAPGSGSLVRFVNPEAMLGVGRLAEHPVLGEVAGDARARLERAARALGQLRS